MSSGRMPRLRQTLTILFALLPLIGGMTSLGPALATEGPYVYYGYAPPRVWAIAEAHHHVHYRATEEWVIRPETVVTKVPVLVIANRDNTRLQAYALPSGESLGEFTLNRLENATVHVQNGTMFKVVADKPATVLLTTGLTFNSFFTSADGGFVGKEFIFAANSTGATSPFMVYAIEDAEVTLTDSAGGKISSFRLRANEYQSFGFARVDTYVLAATGRVVVQSFYAPYSGMGTCFYPAVQGGYVGQAFVGSSAVTDAWPPYVPPAFVFTSNDEAKVTVLDVESQKEALAATVPAGNNVTAQVKAPAMIAKSDRAMMVMAQNYGLAFATLKAGETVTAFIPTDVPPGEEITYRPTEGARGEAYIFAYKETVVTLDDTKVKLAPDGSMAVPPGMHKVSATEDALLEVVNWPLYPTTAGLESFGACIPSVQVASIAYPGLSLKPLGGETMTYLYYGAGAAVVIAVIVAIWARTRRSKQTVS